MFCFLTIIPSICLYLPPSAYSTVVWYPLSILVRQLSILLCQLSTIIWHCLPFIWGSSSSHWLIHVLTWPINCRKDTTLHEILTTLCNTTPQILEFRHPLTQYFYHAIYANGAHKGHFIQKELSIIYSCNILGGVCDGCATIYESAWGCRGVWDHSQECVMSLAPSVRVWGWWHSQQEAMRLVCPAQEGYWLCSHTIIWHDW